MAASRAREVRGEAVKCHQIHPLLAAYVDSQLEDLERQAVDEHLAECADCRELLDEQRAAVAAYAAYPVEEPGEEEWQAVWDGVESRLPAPAKRLTLESLADVHLNSEFLGEEEAPAKVEPTAARSRPSPRVVPAPATAEAEPGGQRGRSRPRREFPRFKPTRIPRMRHVIWAHVAAVAAAVLIAVLTLLGVKPVIHTEELAKTGQVEISFDVTGSPADPMVIVLRGESGEDIPMVWVSQAPGEPSGQEEEAIQ